MNQELRDAISAVEGMLSLYRSLQHVEKVLKAAYVAEAVVVEREAALAKVDAELAKRREELDGLDKTHKARVCELEDEYSAQRRNLAEQLVRDENERVKRMEAADAAFLAAEDARARLIEQLDAQVATQKAEFEALSGRVNELRAIQVELQNKLRAAA